MPTVYTNGLPFTVLEGRQAEDTGLEVWIYSQDEPTSNPIGVLDNSRAKAFLRELNGPGTGEFEVGIDDPDAQGDVLKTGNLASLVLRSIKQKTFVISEFENVEVSDDEEAGRWTRVSGEGEESLFRQIVIYPEVPYSETGATKRLFTYVSFDYDDSLWTDAVSFKKQNENAGRYDGYPILWPDQDAEWIWSSYNEGVESGDGVGDDTAPVGISYFRKEFTLAEPTLCHFYATADDAFEMHLDGQFLMAGGGIKEWRRPYGTSKTLPAGNHLLAVRAENITRPESLAASNVAAFIATVLAETGSTARSEWQRVTLEADEGVGSFTLTFRGETTTPLAYPPIISEVEAALEALDAIDDVSVGEDMIGMVYNLEIAFFGDAVTGIDQPMIEVDASGLSNVKQAKVTEVTKGGSAEIILRTDSTWRALDYPVIPPAMTPGAVMLTGLEEGEERGSKTAPYFTVDFTATHDSKGQLWADPEEPALALVVDMEFNVGDTLLDVLNKLREMGVEAEVDPNFKLSMWRKKGVDRSLQLPELPSVNIRPAHNVTGLSREKQGMPTNTLLVRARETYVERTMEASETAYGRREGFLSLGDTLSTPMLNRQVNLAFEREGLPVDNLVVSVEAFEHHRPLEDFVTGDYVRLYALDGTWDKIRMISVAVVETDDGEIAYEVEIGVPKLEAAQRLERWLYVATNGTLRGTLYSAEGVTSTGEAYSSFVNPPLIDEAGGGNVSIPYATTVVAETTFGKTSSVGTSDKVARQDHSHGTPPDPIPMHVADDDPHGSAAYTDAEIAAHLANDEHGGASDVTAHNEADDAHTGELLRAKDGGRGVVRAASVSGAVTVDLAAGNDHVLTVTGEVTGVTLTGATAGVMCSVTVQWVQDAAGGHAIANPAGVTWLGSETGALTDPNAVSLFTFWTIDGGTTWYGAAAGGGGGAGGPGDLLYEADAAGAFTVDIANGTFQVLTVTADATLSLAGATEGEVSSVTVQAVQDATGGHDVVWPTVTWLPGGEPVEDPTPGATALVTFWTTDGGASWYGTYSTNAGEELRQANASGATTVDLGDGTFHLLTLTGDATLTLAGALAGRLTPITIQFVQDATGGHAVTWPDVTWLPGSPPALSSVAGESSMVTVWSPDGGTTWYGNYAAGSAGYSETVGDGTATSFVIEHNLGTTDLLVQVQNLEVSPPALMWPDTIEFTDATTITLGFAAAPATDGRRVLIKAVT